MPDYTRNGNEKWSWENDAQADMRASNERAAARDRAHRAEMDRLHRENQRRTAEIARDRRFNEKLRQKLESREDSSSYGSSPSEKLTGLGKIITLAGFGLIIASLFTAYGLEWFGDKWVGVAVGAGLAAVKYVAKAVPFLGILAAIFILANGIGTGEGILLGIPGKMWGSAVVVVFLGFLFNGLILKEA